MVEKYYYDYYVSEYISFRKLLEIKKTLLEYQIFAIHI